MIAIPMKVQTSAVSIPMDVDNTDVLFGMKIATAYVTKAGEIYQGAYEFTPTEEEQTALTAGKVLLHDITFHKIPNNWGKITYNGSVLTVT